MTSGWPQDDQDLRWPYPDADGARPGSRTGGRVITDSERSDRSAAPLGADHPSAPLPVTRDPQPRGRRGRSAAEDDRSAAPFGADHPSAPLPVTRDPEPRGRFGRGKARDRAGFAADSPGDADYDWIQYLGEAGPAQEHSRRATDSRAPSAEAPSAQVPSAQAPSAQVPSAQAPSGRPFSTWAPATSPPSARAASAPPVADRPASIPPASPDDRGRRAGGMLSRRHDAPERPATSRHAVRPTDPSTVALPVSPAQPDQSQPDYRQSDYRQPDYRQSDYHQPDYRQARPDDRPSRPNYAIPDPGTEWAPSGPLTTGRPSRQDAESSAPWPTAPQPPEARIAPPEQRTGGHRAVNPAGRPRTSAFDRPHRRAGQQPGGAELTDPRSAAAVQAPPAMPVPARSPVRPAPGKSAPGRSAPVDPTPAKSEPASRRASTDRKGSRRSGKRKGHPVLLVLGGGAVLAAAAGGVVVSGVLSHGSTGPDHQIVTPQKLLSYVQDPALAKGMGAQALRNEIVTKGGGEASHVVDAVYEDTAGAAAKKSPLILLFVGGNLSGSAGGFISSFTGLLPTAFTINAGSLGGQAACVPGSGGHPAECAWADNDTFGLIASPTLSANALASELRSMRPLVERTRK